MQHLSPPAVLLVIPGVFWGLAAGFLPYPALVTLGKGGNIDFFLGAMMQNLHWLVVSALVAGCTGAMLSLPFKHRNGLHWQAACSGCSRVCSPTGWASLPGSRSTGGICRCNTTSRSGPIPSIPARTPSCGSVSPSAASRYWHWGWSRSRHFCTSGNAFCIVPPETTSEQDTRPSVTSSWPSGARPGHGVPGVVRRIPFLTLDLLPWLDTA